VWQLVAYLLSCKRRRACHTLFDFSFCTTSNESRKYSTIEKEYLRRTPLQRVLYDPKNLSNICNQRLQILFSIFGVAKPSFIQLQLPRKIKNAKSLTKESQKNITEPSKTNTSEDREKSDSEGGGRRANNR